MRLVRRVCHCRRCLALHLSCNGLGSITFVLQGIRFSHFPYTFRFGSSHMPGSPVQACFQATKKSQNTNKFWINAYASRKRSRLLSKNAGFIHRYTLSTHCLHSCVHDLPILYTFAAHLRFHRNCISTHQTHFLTLFYYVYTLFSISCAFTILFTLFQHTHVTMPSLYHDLHTFFPTDL